MQTIDQALAKLQTSKFRASFHLTQKEKDYARAKGRDTIKNHAKEIVQKRLAPAYIENDGHQTPMKNHPVFKAQHATGCCCRGCLNKWYRVEKDVALTDEQVEKIVNLLMAWIDKEMNW